MLAVAIAAISLAACMSYNDVVVAPDGRLYMEYSDGWWFFAENGIVECAPPTANGVLRCITLDIQTESPKARLYNTKVLVQHRDQERVEWAAVRTIVGMEVVAVKKGGERLSGKVAALFYTGVYLAIGAAETALPLEEIEHFELP